MATVSTISELNSAIEKQIISGLNDIRVKLPKYLEEYIETEYYDQYQPAMYERTKRILSAITSSKIVNTGGSYYIEVFLDPAKVSYDPSVWSYDRGSTWQYLKGDDVMTVWNNMAQGIHGDSQYEVTSGRFWQEFLKAIGAGGVYDVFINFKKHLAQSGLDIV